MMNSIITRHRASIIGVLILAAYSMLTYSITKNITLGIVTDIISGLAVIGIPLLLLPFFKTEKNKKLTSLYLVCRTIEGLLMILGGVILIIPSLQGYRDIIYRDVQIYFFIFGALLFYILLYRTLIIPRFISIWGIIATLALFIVTIFKLFGIEVEILNALVIPIILNELFLAIWLIIEGFN
ncbi:uncharacterized protein DUF4386 [Maribacter vaceletii]|uniref:Uncharacterized protein DUF4386 n=1 Tax=Maribacter vaceletii TaxID=1206816 RepID=A0A495E8S6_9FLAO|nr:DUF4386 domain-containing protein [Maribacter vaceletii]RKR13061.1 uncharacterized protein DUF4386 [Maribacter vaceletii]